MLQILQITSSAYNFFLVELIAISFKTDDLWYSIFWKFF